VPGVSGGRRVASVVSQVDLMPTLLALAGLPPPRSIEGESLLPAIEGAAFPLPRVARSYRRQTRREEAAVTTTRFRLLVTRYPKGRQKVALYDRVADPGETVDVKKRFPIATAYLRSVLGWPTGAARSLARPAGQEDDEGMAQLRALGYVE